MRAAEKKFVSDTYYNALNFSCFVIKSNLNSICYCPVVNKEVLFDKFFEAYVYISISVM